MSDFLFAVDAVLPVFLLMLLGLGAARKGLVTETWRNATGPFVFRLCLPALVFDSLYAADFRSVFSPSLVAYILAASLAAIALALAIAPLVSREPGVRGSFIQGAFRGNFAIIALPLVGEVFGPEGRAQASILVAFLIPLYNLASILILAAHSATGADRSARALLKAVVSNPLLVAIAVALPFSVSGLGLPAFLEKTVAYLAAVAVPLALIDIGAGLAEKRQAGRRVAVLVATLVKAVATPLAFAAGAWALGFRGAEFGIALITGAAPSAIVSYTMAKAMGCDAPTAGSIVVWTTGVSIPVAMGAIWFLKAAGAA